MYRPYTQVCIQLAGDAIYENEKKLAGLDVWTCF